MNRYQVVKNGVVTNEWTDAFADQTYYEPGFGTRAWTEMLPVLDSEGNPVYDDNGNPEFTPVLHPATFNVVTTDVTGTALDPRMVNLRARRDELLRQCDWTQMGDSPVTADQRSAWATYRQALRNLPDSAGLNLDNVSWPIPPGSVT